MDNTRGGLCGKTCPEPCLLMKGATSRPFSAASPKSKMERQMFLCLRKENGSVPVRSWETVSLSPGVSSTPRRAGESHKDGGVYLLSSILEERVPERYCLSPKACQGSLLRAKRRGKELPAALKAALERQASAQSTAPTVGA